MVFFKKKNSYKALGMNIGNNRKFHLSDKALGINMTKLYLYAIFFLWSNAIFQKK